MSRLRGLVDFFCPAKLDNEPRRNLGRALVATGATTMIASTAGLGYSIAAGNELGFALTAPICGLGACIGLIGVLALRAKSTGGEGPDGRA